MKCPFCGYEMQEGKICALGAAMEWKDAGGTDAKMPTVQMHSG